MSRREDMPPRVQQGARCCGDSDDAVKAPSGFDLWRDVECAQHQKPAIFEMFRSWKPTAKLRSSGSGSSSADKLWSEKIEEAHGLVPELSSKQLNGGDEFAAPSRGQLFPRATAKSSSANKGFDLSKPLSN
jgi:hypothetical protein